MVQTFNSDTKNSVYYVTIRRESMPTKSLFLPAPVCMWSLQWRITQGKVQLRKALPHTLQLAYLNASMRALSRVCYVQMTEFMGDVIAVCKSTV